MGTSLNASALLFPNKYRRGVLAVLFMRTGLRVHLRELARLIGAAPGPLKRELDLLSAAGLVRKTREGRQVYFTANTEHPVFAELQALLRKTVGLADVLRACLAPLASRITAAFVYGSVASGTEQAESDIDVMVIGEVTFAEVVHALFDAQQVLGREISPKVMPPEEWRRKRAAKQAFVTEVLSRPKIMLLGEERGL
ncbi:MAG: nucleotidyltransferase domain-containing protein [Pseudomonadota bacterium]|jgi:predicted nucleotidyltransferase